MISWQTKISFFSDWLSCSEPGSTKRAEEAVTNPLNPLDEVSIGPSPAGFGAGGESPSRVRNVCFHAGADGSLSCRYRAISPHDEAGWGFRPTASDELLSPPVDV